MLGLLMTLCIACAAAEPDSPAALIDSQLAAHAGNSGIYVLEAGDEALIARAWLSDQAQHTIDLQYFIWSTDNIGILAAEGILRAADRGVRIRVLIDDLLMDAPDRHLLALSLHPNIDIRIYNPKSSARVPLLQRIRNVFVDFRGLNQRMHDKTFIVDGRVAIAGGRNMAAEYFDYNHRYNFRDRDALLVGPVIADMQANFEAFWASRLSVPVEALYADESPFGNPATVDDTEVQQAYRELHAYAASPANFAPEVRAAIAATPTSFPRLTQQMTWGQMEFISDRPGKNYERTGLGGGGLTTSALARLIAEARQQVVIQSPYLVMSKEALALFGAALARGVRVRINTNSLASTDNLPAFSGYRRARRELLRMGFEIYEYRPDAASQLAQMQRQTARVAHNAAAPPAFGLHAKTMVVDSRITYIGTFNLDPRSENLNTEVGVVVRNAALSEAVEAQMQSDMRPGNSWNAATDDPDSHASLWKRIKVWFWQLLPLNSIL